MERSWKSYAAVNLRRCKVNRLLYRAAVFFLIMPHLAERSINLKVCGTKAVAPLESFAVSSLRIARIW